MIRSGDRETTIGDVSAEPPEPFSADLRIDSPGTGATVEGEWSGTGVMVRGSLTTSGAGVLDRVEVTFGAAAPTRAAATSPGFANWETVAHVASSGTYAVVVRAYDSGGRKVGEQTATVTVALAAKPPDAPPPAPPRIAPTVSITAPVAGTAFAITPNVPLEIEIAGTTADPDGRVSTLELFVDGARIALQPGLAWTAKARLLGAGRHTITAYATDNDGKTATATVEVQTVKQTAKPVVERLMIVEKCDLSTMRVAYGVGPTVKVISLVPGAKETLTVKSYRRDTQTASEAASILDSHETTTRTRFENSVEAERSNKATQDERNEWSVEAQGEVKFGLTGSASIKGSVSGSSNAVREDMTRTVSKAVAEHASDASSKRQVEIKTSSEMKIEEGQEFSSETRIENINLSRTVNYLFSQVVEKFVTLLHITDVRIAYVRADEVVDPNSPGAPPTLRWTYEEVSLAQLDPLLRAVIMPGKVDQVRSLIKEALSNVFDYEDEAHQVFEVKELRDAADPGQVVGSYLRFPKHKISSYVDRATGATIEVPGVILSAIPTVMRSDGIVCDTALGLGEALDRYNRALQEEAVAARGLENDRSRAGVAKEELARRLVETGDAEGARIFRDVFPAAEQESLALVTAPAAQNGTS